MRILWWVENLRGTTLDDFREDFKTLTKGTDSAAVPTQRLTEDSMHEVSQDYLLPPGPPAGLPRADARCLGRP